LDKNTREYLGNYSDKKIPALGRGLIFNISSLNAHPESDT